jgi:uncharacterized lipoprotein YehR (DUF1307 family)
MEITKRIMFAVFAVVLSVGLCGCGKKSADAGKPMEQVKTEAEKMSTSDLRSTAMAYKDAITAKKGELETLVAKLKAIPLAEKLGEKAKSLNAEIGKVNESITALTERFRVYFDKLKEKGGDVSGLTI